MAVGIFLLSQNFISVLYIISYNHLVQDLWVDTTKDMVDTLNKDTVDSAINKASISFHPCPLVVELTF